VSFIRTFCGVSCLLLALPAAAQRYEFKVYGREDGLTNLAITSIAQDRTGFLWVATPRGLLRYNGNRFETFGAEHGLPATPIQAMHLATDGSLWIATRDFLTRQIGGQFQSFRLSRSIEVVSRNSLTSDATHLYLGTSKGLHLVELRAMPGQFRMAPIHPRGMPDGEVQAVANSRTGIWFGCGNRLCRLAQGRVEVFDASRGVPNDRWQAIVEDQAGDVWARSVTRLLVRRHGSDRFTSQDGGLPQAGFICSLLNAPDGSLLVSTGRGVAVRRGDRWHLVGPPQGLPANGTSCLFRDREDGIWIGFWGSGLTRWLGYGKWEGWTPAEGLVHESVSAIARDAHNRLWIGTDGGLNLFSPGAARWPLWSARDGLPADKVRSIQAAGHMLWIGALPGGVASFDPDTRQIHRYGPAQGLTDDRLNGMQLDAENRLWVSTSGGLFRSTGSGAGILFEKLTVPVPEAAEEAYFRMARDRANRLWIAGSRGLLLWDRGRWKRFRQNHGLADNSLSNVSTSSDGSVWVSYRRALGISRLHWPDGTLKVASFTERDGLPSNYILFLGEDSRGRLWVGTDAGIAARVGEDWIAYSQQDGVVWDDCNANAFHADNNGEVWIGTSRGLAHLTAPNRVKLLSPVPAVLSSAYLGSTEVTPGRSWKVPYQANSFTAELASLSFLNRGIFRYRMSGADDQWTETSQPLVRYPALYPGTFTFEAMAGDAHGHWSPSPVSLTFTVAPPWYRSWWFRTLYVLVALGLIGLAVRWKARSLVREQARLKAAVEQRTGELFSEKAVVEHQKQEIEALLLKAKEANEMKSQFLANTSHEIRTPMNGILGALALTLETELNDEQRDYLTIARQSANSLLALLNDILDLSKIEANRMELAAVPFCIRESVEQSIQTIVVRASEKGLAVHHAVAADVPELVVGDPGRLGQVLINLLGNAIKFTDRGHIRVDVQVEERSADDVTMRFSVADTGIGIARDKQALIFEPFRQVDGSSARSYGGTGLGLAISSRLAAMMNGRIWLESAVGAGSTFYFTAQFALRPALKPLTNCHEADPANGSCFDILVAEDNRVNQLILSRLLERKGHRVETAANGEEVLVKLAQREFDVILMDVQMPNLDGLATTRRIREMEQATGSRLTIIALTANAMQGDREKCLNAGMNDYLAKPVNPQELYAMLNRATPAKPPA
jgi:signal transduction histidine kinase/ligand-binding sensor domain-containing protein/CheY-like chemotaxis protein